MQPLKGLTVVTLEHAIAAPLCTRHLADLGARVIKVERPGSGGPRPDSILADTGFGPATRRPAVPAHARWSGSRVNPGSR